MQYYKTDLIISNRDELIKIILDLYNDSKKDNTALARGNIISTYNINKELHLNPAFKDLVNQLEKHLRLFFKSPLSITEMWANVTRNGGSLSRHTHAPNTAVGVFYLQEEKDCGNILLGYDEEISVSTNLLLLFGGDVEHRTMLNSSDADRIVVGFISN
jgi:hypothetical protein